MKNWQKKARDFYDKEYYSKNDKAHNIDHADDVYENMLKFNKKQKLLLDNDLIFMIAYVHDLFSTIDRNHHHVLARDYVLHQSDEYLKLFKPSELEIISKAVYEHRASGSCTYSNNYTLAIMIADKGRPVLSEYIVRSYKYNSKTNSHRKAVEGVLDHLRDKFGRNGYGFKCEFFKDYYKEDLEVFWSRLDKLTLDEIEDVILNKE